MRLVLASSSPRRREILGWLGLEFEVVQPDAEELTGGLEPARLVLENARRKARAGAEIAPEGALVLGVDTDVFLAEAPLGKPETPEEARERLLALSGATHTVLSGVCVLGPRPGQERSDVAASQVTFAELDDEVIELYLASEEWRGRAGGYAIQGLGSLLVENLAGDFSNVVGLPIRLLLRLAPELAPKP